MEKFLSFLDGLKTEENSALVESIGKGYVACFEAELVATLGIRRISDHEAQAKQQMHPEAQPGYFNGGFVVVDPRDNPIAFAPSMRDAEFIKGNLESKAKSMLELKIPDMPPSVIARMEDDPDPNIAPDIRKMEDTGRQQFIVFKKAWDEYTDFLNKRLGERQAFIEKYPYFFK